MRQSIAKDPILCEKSAIGVTKCCYIAIGQKLDNILEVEDVELLRDFKIAVAFNEFDKAEAIKEILCKKYLKKTRSGAEILAQSLGVSVQTIQNWKSARVLIPATMAKRLQINMAISPHELRPDLYDESH